ncbi:MAG: hypothetical protein ABIQ29_01280 [Burkholderiaceae bacterium]
MHAIIGIVGYYGFVRGYPLGPELMERLQAQPWPTGVEIREMNWGPVAIVQDFQAQADKPERVVLVGALDRGLDAGSVSCRRWAGGALDSAAVQRRMFEAVTGVISLDNLLVIGAQFGIWPEQTFTVEMQWPESGLGDLVLGEIEIDRGRGQVVGERPLSPDNDRIVQRLVDAVRALALDDTPRGVTPLTAAQLTPVAKVMHHRFIDELGPST